MESDWFVLQWRSREDFIGFMTENLFPRRRGLIKGFEDIPNPKVMKELCREWWKDHLDNESEIELNVQLDRLSNVLPLSNCKGWIINTVNN